MNTLADFRRAFADGEAMARTSGVVVPVRGSDGTMQETVMPTSMEILAKLTAILTRCDDLDAMCAADGRLDPNQVRIDSARIRHMAEKARALVVGREA